MSNGSIRGFRVGELGVPEDCFEDVEAYDAAEAAETYAADWDAAASALLRGQVVKFLVIDEEGHRSMFEVMGEAVPEYTAYECDDDEGGGV